MTTSIRPSGDVVALDERLPSGNQSSAVTIRGARLGANELGGGFDGIPAAGWDLGRLGRRADFEGEQIAGCEIDAAPHYWIIGVVLRLAKPGVAHGQWGHWLKAHGIDASRAYRARLLAAAFASLDQLEGLTLREAMRLALAARDTAPTDVKRDACRRLRAVARSLAKIQEDVKNLEDRAPFLPLIQAVEQGLASLRSACEAP
jgi:hypothetical protein